MFRAPEAIEYVVGEKIPFGPEADVWSFGVIVYYLYFERLPFSDDQFNKILK